MYLFLMNLFSIYEQDKFHAQLNWEFKILHNLEKGKKTYNHMQCLERIG